MSGTRNKGSYWMVLEPFNSEELLWIGQLKRFFECLQGDREFREFLSKGEVRPEHAERLKEVGVTFDLEEVAMLWEEPEVCRDLLESTGSLQRDELSEKVTACLAKYPMIDLWFRFISRRNRVHSELRKRVEHVPENAEYDAWRMRRINSVRSELGYFGLNIDHPVLAFELGDGCSVGCWFCAFSARRLENNYDYTPENRETFRTIVASCVDLFGRDGAGRALLYYGTEPHDNPHYLDFMKEFESLTGVPSCTATTACTDAPWLRDLIGYYREGMHPWPRLSVLSTSVMRKVHELYTPDELRDVEMLMQMKEHYTPKVTGGRILEENSGLKGRDDEAYLESVIPQGSIACVSGFLVNLVNRTVQVVSPCYTSKRWPLGYRVFDEITYDDAAGFRRAVDTLIERNMGDRLRGDRIACFRDDLEYRPTDEGFDLVSPNQIHHFRDGEKQARVAALLAKGELTYDQVYEELIGDASMNPLVTMAMIKGLFDEGFLDELQSDPVAEPVS